MRVFAMQPPVPMPTAVFSWFSYSQGIEEIFSVKWTGCASPFVYISDCLKFRLSTLSTFFFQLRLWGQISKNVSLAVNITRERKIVIPLKNILNIKNSTYTDDQFTK